MLNLFLFYSINDIFSHKLNYKKVSFNWEKLLKELNKVSIKQFKKKTSETISLWYFLNNFFLIEFVKNNVNPKIHFSIY